jgi:nitrogen regulatory protein PII 2
MKQVIAVIRDENVEPTQGVLTRLGISSVMILPVTGRGQQKGAAQVPDPGAALGWNAGLHLRRPRPSLSTTVPPGSHSGRGKKSGPGFLPKHMLIIMAPDECVDAVVLALVAVNRSGRHGDGKIFVCPVGRELGMGPDGSLDAGQS